MMAAAAFHREIPALQRGNARRLRVVMTDAEKRLWAELRGHRFGGAGFRRQVPIGPFIADFCCHAARLIIEIDGGQHGTEAGLRRDDERGRFLAAEGYRVLRFWNHEVLTELDAVLSVIWEALAERGVIAAEAATPLPVPPPQGGRERKRRSSDETKQVRRDDGPQSGTPATAPQVPSPPVGEGQGGGSPAPAGNAEAAAGPDPKSSSSVSDAVKQGPTP